MRSFEECVTGGKGNVWETHFEVRMGVGQTFEEELNILEEYLAPCLCNS